MKVLWVSPFAPYDLVGHGGGQNHNYYVKYVKKHTDFEITLITVCDYEEQEKIDLNEYNINNILKVYNPSSIKKISDKLKGILHTMEDGSLLNYGKKQLLLSALQEYYLSGDKPDIVITQWTEATLLHKKIVDYFPTANI